MSARSFARPNPYPGLPNTPAIKTFMIGELVNMIAEELGERSEQDKRYQNLGSLANLILTNKTLFGSLQYYLYAQDLESRYDKGLQHAVFNCSDRVGCRIISKYPVCLIKHRINNEYKNEAVNATFTLLHIAAARQQHRVILKLKELGAKYLEAEDLQNALSQPFNDQLTLESELARYLPNIKWKPALAPLLLGDVPTFNLLTKHWDASSVGTFSYRRSTLPRVVLLSGPTNWPMTVQHLAAILVDRDYSMQLMKKAIKKYPSANELPGGYVKHSVLHFAIKAYNIDVVRYLLESGVGLGGYMVDALGNNPLHCAFNVAMEADRPDLRNICKKMIDEFMDKHHFHQRMIQTCVPYESVLLIAAKSVHLDWSSKYPIIKHVLNKCLRREVAMKSHRDYDPASHEDLINVPDSNGNTVLSYFARAITQRGGSPAIEALFKKLVTEYGADINLDVNSRFTPAFYAHSIKCIADRATGCTKFKRLVNHLGGRLHPAEINGTAQSAFGGTNFGQDSPHAASLPPTHVFAQEHPGY
ncbi:hypothetical protein IL306_013416 [Fusarium sp. DS 682]|nr:hypothetical protein IL306_013416 [Fusarium sp. DS 682]